MIFGRKNKNNPENCTTSAMLSAEDLARDTVASILRILAEYALPTVKVPADEFQKRCEGLARSVLIRNTIDETTGKPVPDERIHADVKQTVREQRRAESLEYSKHRESAQIIVSDLVSTLKRFLERREGHDKEIVRLLAEMESVVEKGDLIAIRRTAAKAAETIRELISEQRTKEREHLSHLSAQLKNMREELAEAQAQMQRDSLTSLLNRGAFDNTFDKTVELSQASASELTLFLIDLDNFKIINDNYGHQLGDEVLKTVSKQFIRCFPRKEDTVVRLGGDEFAVLCRNTGQNEAQMLGERLRSAVSLLEIEIQEILYNPTISVGYAVLKFDETPSDFFKRADDALYKAKREGRNRVETSC